MSTSHKPRSLFFPILLILVGGFLLLNQLNLLPGSTWDVLLRLWPLIFVVGGLDGLLQRSSFTGSILAIGLGAVLLLGNFGYLDASSWQVILKFWPLLIIAAGLDLIIGHRGKLSAVLGVLVGLILVGGLFWLVITPAAARLPQSVTPVTQALEKRTQARLVFNQAVGNLALQKGADPANLVQGELNLVQGEQVNWSMTNNLFEMRAAGDATWMVTSFAPQSRWDLKLTDSIPLGVEFESAVGEQTVDLRGLKVSELNGNLAVGQMHLTLPESGSLRGSLDCAVGRVVIVVPAGAAVRIKAETAVSTVSMPPGFTRNGQVISSPQAATASQVMEITVSLPVGIINIESGN